MHVNTVGLTLGPEEHVISMSFAPLPTINNKYDFIPCMGIGGVEPVKGQGDKWISAIATRALLCRSIRKAFHFQLRIEGALIEE